MKNCEFTSEFIIECPQITSRAYCYYHQKVVDGHIEPEGDPRF